MSTLHKIISQHRSLQLTANRSQSCLLGTSMAWACSRPGCSATDVWLCVECALCFCTKHTLGTGDARPLQCPMCSKDLAEDVTSPRSQNALNPDHPREEFWKLYLCPSCDRFLVSVAPWEPCRDCHVNMYACRAHLIGIHCSLCDVWLNSTVAWFDHRASTGHLDAGRARRCKRWI